MRYIITGGCGFIGTNLINRILKDEPASGILIIDNMLYGTNYLDDKSFIIIKRDIGGYKDGFADFYLSNPFGNFDVMIHLAANTGVIPSIENPIKDMESNVQGTLKMLELCRYMGIKKFIYASSGAVLGEQEPPLHEEMVAKPISPYGVSKLAGENYCRAYSETFGIDTVAFRFSNVYGPYSYHKNSLIAKYIKAILNGYKSFPIYGDGKQTRDFIYVDDLVEAIMLAIKSNVSNEVFQLCTFKEYSVLDIVEKLNKISKSLLWNELYWNYEAERAGEVKRSFADNSKIGKVLGFKPEWNIDDGLKETFQWFVDHATLG